MPPETALCSTTCGLVPLQPLCFPLTFHQGSISSQFSEPLRDNQSTPVKSTSLSAGSPITAGRAPASQTCSSPTARLSLSPTVQGAANPSSSPLPEDNALKSLTGNSPTTFPFCLAHSMVHYFLNSPLSLRTRY